MGRRKIEIKAIKDDRNRSVTFLKRKGGLFKKAHELSVLCSVDVAVFIFGSNKKLYEYSSGDMRDLIARYTYHGGPNEHKGPSDFNGGGDDGSDDEVDASPPNSQNEAMDAHMMPPQYHGQPPFQHLRHQTPSASPPIPNGFTFIQHPNSIPRAHTPQPPVGSRPTSRNDMRRVSQPMAQPGPPQGHQINGYAFIPQPAIYNPQTQQGMPASMPPGTQYQYAQAGPNHGPPPHVQQHYPDERHSSLPPNFPPHGPQPANNSLPPPPLPHQQRHSVSPQPTPQQLPQSIPQSLPPSMPQPLAQSIPRTSPPQPSSLPPPPTQIPVQASPQMQPTPQPQPQQPPQQQQPPQPSPPQQTSQPPTQPVISEPQPPTPVEPKPDTVSEWHEVKKLPQRKQYSIFTPIDESRSILSQHLAAFQGDSSKDPSTTSPPRNAKINGNGEQRSQSIDSGAVARGSISSSPPNAKNADGLPSLPQPRSRVSMSSIPETIFTPPSRQNSLRPGGPLRPRLRVEIPPDGSEDNSTATANSASSPRNPSDGSSLGARRNGEPPASGMVLPPPSPSASALLSAGASGPPNPFARPPPHQNSSGGMNIDTPASALPSRFLNNELLPSPSSFYPDWGFGRGSDSATLPSPLNFATPVVGTGPSFLRDDHTSNKRKSPEVSAGPPSSDPIDHASDAKRVKVDS